MNGKNEDLASAIRSLMTTGIRLTRDVVEYLDSTTGLSTPEMLSRLTAGPSDCETESLRELVFFPDEKQQVWLEPHLENAAFNEVDIDEITGYLVREGFEAVLVFPNDSGRARLPVDEASLRRFICRLKITRTIDSRLAQEISRRFGETERRYRLRVILRNARFPFTGNAVGFLGDFLSRIAPDVPDYMDLFGFCCDTLEHAGSGEDPYAALMNRKSQCTEMIRRTKKSEQELRQQPVEALMLKGISVSCMDMDEARRHIGWIDRVSLAIFGKTEVFDRQLAMEEAEPVDLGVFGKNGDDIDRIIKILS